MDPRFIRNEMYSQAVRFIVIRSRIAMENSQKKSTRKKKTIKKTKTISKKIKKEVGEESKKTKEPSE
jgi:hypothetical protein